MGVKALWSLLEKLGTPVDLDTLQNQVLAIDFSIWLNQAIKGYRDKRGRPVENAHLLGLFQRICKLLFYKIKPVFVFDGSTPYLKRQTIEARNNRKLKSLQSSERTASKALHTYLSKQLNTPVNIDVDVDAEIGLESTRRILLQDEAIFDLPVLEEKQESSDEEFAVNINGQFAYDSKLNEYQNIDNIDIESESFKSLPAEIRHEFLTQLKEKRKGWTKIKDFPIETTDFSNYQMNRLLHKREIQKNIEKVEDEMQNTAELDMCFEWMSNPVKCKSRRMMSDERTHLIYVDRSKANILKTKTENKSILNLKKSESVFADVSEFDYGKSDAIKKDNSSFVQSTSSFSSIKTTKILRRNLNSDLKNSKSSTVTSTFIPFQEYEDIVDEGVSRTCSNVVESENTIDKSQCDKSFKQNSRVTEMPTKDADLIDLMSDSIDSIEFVSETSEKPVRSKVPIRSEPMLNSALQVNGYDFEPIIARSSANNLSNCTQSTVQSSRANTSDKQPDNITAIAEIVEDCASVVNSSANENENTEKETCDASPVNHDSLENSPQKRNRKLFTQLRQSIAASPSKEVRRELGKELYTMEREVGRLERHANTVSEQMIVECQELLRLFGIPYVVSPMEAEAQCAALENLGLTSGTITDDSDIWLFGGKTVYKNFFTQSKFVEMYKSKDIEEHLKLNRAAMICLALLTGSDYTEGVEGVGAVTAVEILSEFNEPGFEALLSFKKWWSDKQRRDKSPGNKTRAKFIKLTLNEGFPSRVVFDAYWSPQVDETQESFRWGVPDLDLLRDFAISKFGWTLSKVDETLLPVIKRLNEKKVQKRIDDYFKCDIRRNGQVAGSKRVMSAISKLGIGTGDKNTKKTKILPTSTLKQKINKNTIRGRSKAKTKATSNPQKSSKKSKRNESQKSQLSESSSSED